MLDIEGLEGNSFISNITYSIGKKYLIDVMEGIINSCCSSAVRQELLEEYSTSLDEHLCSMYDDKYLYSISLSETPLQQINDSKEVITDGVVGEVPTNITMLINTFKLSIPHIVEDIGSNTIKKFIAIIPQGKYEEELVLSNENNNIETVMFKIKPMKFLEYSSWKGSNESTAFVYGLSLSYLIFINHIYNFVQEHQQIGTEDFNIETFLFDCFSNIVPIITGVTNTSIYKTIDFNAQDLIWEMFQLDANDDLLGISKKPQECSIIFKYTPNSNPFVHSLSKHFYNNSNNKKKYQPFFKYDNSGKRNITLKVYLSKEGYLCLNSSMIGLNSILDVTDLTRQYFYPWVTDKDEYLYTNLHILSRILSHTKQHEDLIAKAREIAYQRYPNATPMLLSYDEEDSEEIKLNTYVSYYINNTVRKHTFKNISQTSIVDTALIKKFKLQNYKEDYIIIANELAALDDSEVEELISDLDHNQKDKIWERVKFVRKKCKVTHLLQRFYTNLLNEGIL